MTMRARPEPPATVSVALDGHLTLGQLEGALKQPTALLASGRPIGLLVDCRTMRGYDGDARALFVAWNAEHRRQIVRVAVVTDNTLWHMVVSAMALASRQSMRAFSAVDRAEQWLRLG